MKFLVFTLIIFNFALSHAGRIDNYYRGLSTIKVVGPWLPGRTWSGRTWSDSHLQTRRSFYRLNPLVTEEEKDDFYQSISRGDVESVRRTIRKNPSFVHIKDRDKRTPLHIAAIRGYRNSPKIAEILIKHGAEVNFRDIYGRTPLYEARHARNFGVARVLVKSGAHSSDRRSYRRFRRHGRR